MALWTTPDPASDDQVIIVVGHPGDRVEVLTGREVTGAGETRDLRQTSPMENGAGAVRPARPFSWPYGSELPVGRSDPVGVSFPSGATITHLVVSWGSAEERMTSMAVLPDPAPARAPRCSTASSP